MIAVVGGSLEDIPGPPGTIVTNDLTFPSPDSPRLCRSEPGHRYIRAWGYPLLYPEHVDCAQRRLATIIHQVGF